MAAVLALLAGCGSSSSSSSSDNGSDASASKCGDGTAAKAGADAAQGIPAPNKELADWGQEKDASCVYQGPGNFSIDVNKCPSDWDINAGITDKEIRLFTSMPHSGALAASGKIGDGMASYVKYVNSQGGIDGRKIVFDIKDDQYQPDLTRKNVDQAIQSNDYAASFAILGTANNLNTREVMNQQCMPQLLVASSDDQFFDPQGYPWTTGFGLDRFNETALWADALKQEFPDGAKVVMITMDNDLGKSYADGFRRAAKGTNLEIVGEELHDVAAPSIENQITSAAATKADVVLLNTAGTFCIQGLEGIEKSDWKPRIISSNACAQISTTYAPLLEAGATGNDSEVIRYYYAPSDPDVGDKAFAQFMEGEMKKQGLDPNDGQLANGWWWAYNMVQVLQNATIMKGGLNRANIDVAAHAYDGSSWPLLVDGVQAKVSGVDDAFPFEAGQMYKYVGGDADGKKLGHFEPVGDLIDNSGQLKNYQAATGGQ
jgi:ABC-type branched-subunit amino acid transport system substrate-binding protein